MENCIAPMVVKRTLFARPVASFLFGASFSTYFPAKTRLQRYVEEVSSLPSSTVEEKTVTEDELRVEEVIARINTNAVATDTDRQCQ